jgi:hypothetical protein
VGRQIVHDDRIAGPKRRGEALFDIGCERLAMHRAIQHQGRLDATQAERADEGRRHPVAVWHGCPAAFAPGRPPVASGHLGRDAGRIDEVEMPRVERRLGLEPG